MMHVGKPNQRYPRPTPSSNHRENEEVNKKKTKRNEALCPSYMNCGGKVS